MASELAGVGSKHITQSGDREHAPTESSQAQGACIKDTSNYRMKKRCQLLVESLSLKPRKRLDFEPLWLLQHLSTSWYPCSLPSPAHFNKKGQVRPESGQVQVR